MKRRGQGRYTRTARSKDDEVKGKKGSIVEVVMKLVHTVK
jgi:hypothetical protein